MDAIKGRSVKIVINFSWCLITCHTIQDRLKRTGGHFKFWMCTIKKKKGRMNPGNPSRVKAIRYPGSHLYCFSEGCCLYFELLMKSILNSIGVLSENKGALPSNRFHFQIIRTMQVSRYQGKCSATMASREDEAAKP